MRPPSSGTPEYRVRRPARGRSPAPAHGHRLIPSPRPSVIRAVGVARDVTPVEEIRLLRAKGLSPCGDRPSSGGHDPRRRVVGRLDRTPRRQGQDEVARRIHLLGSPWFEQASSREAETGQCQVRLAGAQAGRPATAPEPLEVTARIFTSDFNVSPAGSRRSRVNAKCHSVFLQSGE